MLDRFTRTDVDVAYTRALRLLGDDWNKTFVLDWNDCGYTCGLRHIETGLKMYFSHAARPERGDDLDSAFCRTPEEVEEILREWGWIAGMKVDTNLEIEAINRLIATGIRARELIDVKYPVRTWDDEVSDKLVVIHHEQDPAGYDANMAINTMIRDLLAMRFEKEREQRVRQQ